MVNFSLSAEISEAQRESLRWLFPAEEPSTMVRLEGTLESAATDIIIVGPAEVQQDHTDEQTTLVSINAPYEIMTTSIISYHITRFRAARVASKLNDQVPAESDDGSIWTRYHISESGKRIKRYYVYVEKHYGSKSR